MHKNSIWKGFLAVLGLIAAFYVFDTSLHLYHYYVGSAVNPGLSFPIKKTVSAIVLVGIFVYFVGLGIYVGKRDGRTNHFK